MLFDIFYDETGKASPVFFYDVSIESGILNCEVPENDRMMESTHILPPEDSEYTSLLYEFKKNEDLEFNKEGVL
jgi:hypothetical protein